MYCLDLISAELLDGRVGIDPVPPRCVEDVGRRVPFSRSAPRTTAAARRFHAVSPAISLSRNVSATVASIFLPVKHRK